MGDSAVYNLCDSHDVISFDIFDTLLVRPYAEPVDLFQHLEVLSARSGFRVARIKAESLAISAKGGGGQEVTLDEIYAALAPSFADLKDDELALEAQTLRVDYRGASLYSAALATGKPVILVSDTYLSENFLTDVLRRNGIDGFTRCFVSSAWGKTKRVGDIFDLVAETMAVTPNRILHIGDNFHSDHAMAIARGWHSYLVQRPLDRFLTGEPDQRVRELLARDDLPVNVVRDLSTMATLTARSSTDSPTRDGFWFNAGLVFAGPLAYSFAEWIAAEALRRDFREVVFVARDGYHLHNIVSRFFPSLKSHYVYLNRRVIRQLQDAPGQRAAFVAQLETMCVAPGRILLVDVGTNKFSAQRFLLSQGIECQGLYWRAGANPQDIEFATYYQGGDPEADVFLGSGLIEFFLTSPEPPVCGVNLDGETIAPVYGQQHPAEQRRIEAVREIGRGIQAFTSGVKAVFGTVPLQFTAASVVHWNNLWLLRPRPAERAEYGAICHADDDDHLKYVRQFRFDHQAPTEQRGLIRRVEGVIRSLLSAGRRAL